MGESGVSMFLTHPFIPVRIDNHSQHLKTNFFTVGDRWVLVSA